jgi:hypothetical protein
LIAVACGQSPPVANGWLQVKEQTQCEALNPSFCVGTYGFTLRRDGTYVVGPAPDGSVMSGSVPATDRARIDADVSALEGQDQECESAVTVPGVVDTVDLTTPNHSPTGPTVSLLLVFDLGSTPNRTCYVGGRDHVIRLHDDLRALMARYYATPFPAV